jgi:hypothetical protein
LRALKIKFEFKNSQQEMESTGRGKLGKSVFDMKPLGELKGNKNVM